MRRRVTEGREQSVSLTDREHPSVSACSGRPARTAVPWIPCYLWEKRPAIASRSVSRVPRCLGPCQPVSLAGLFSSPGRLLGPLLWSHALLHKGPSPMGEGPELRKLVAGAGLNLRPLGYEQAGRRPSPSNLLPDIAGDLGRSAAQSPPVSPVRSRLTPSWSQPRSQARAIALRRAEVSPADAGCRAACQRPLGNPVGWSGLLRAGGHQFSRLVAACSPGGRGLGGQRDHSLSCEGLGEAV